MKLASIERVTKLTPIPGADKIETADVLGYKVVVKKGEFQEGDLGVFHFPDTVVDETNPVYSFLKEKRLKVIKLRKQVSQGLLLPITVFNFGMVEEGADVTEVVKIRKYEKEIPISLAGQMKGDFPSILIKTDEQNLRGCPKAIEEFRGKTCYITKKVDGTSASFYLNNGEFGVCSRNRELKETAESVYWQIARKYKVEEALRQYAMLGVGIGDYCIQGEIYGPGIQGNKTGVTEVGFAMFNLLSVTKRSYCSLGELAAFSLLFDIPMVEMIWEGIFYLTLEQLLEMANNLEYRPGFPAEGIVIRPNHPCPSVCLDSGRLSGKVISETFCLKYGE